MGVWDVWHRPSPAESHSEAGLREPAPPRPRRGRGTKSRRSRRTAAEGPPILVRYPGGRVPSPAASRGRRRFKGRGRPRRPLARFRLPARWLAWTWFGALALAVAMLIWHPALRVQRIQVRGLRWLDPDQVAAQTMLQQWRGRPLAAVDAKQVAALIRAEWPALDQVRVQVAWPGTLLIEAHERQPVLVWQVGRQSWWVDAQGVAFAPLGEADPTWPVVEVWVEANAEPPPPPNAQQVAMAQALWERVGPDVALVYHPWYGFGWRAPQGWVVFMGHEAAGLDVRMTVYEALVDTLSRRELHPTWLDLSAWQTPTLHFDNEAR